MKRYGLVGEYDLFIDEVDDGEYYGADEVDDTIAKQQAEIDEARTIMENLTILIADEYPSGLADQLNSIALAFIDKHRQGEVMTDIVEAVNRFNNTAMSNIKRVGERLKETQKENERLQAEIDKILNDVSDMECSCLPYAEQTGYGVCPRCRLMAKYRR